MSVSNPAESTPTSAVNIDLPFLFDWGNAPGTGPYFTANNVDAATQLTSAALMGSICLLVFSFLRVRWPELYSHRLRLRHMRPAHLPRTLFGWIYPMVTMSDRHVLETMGLDAVLYLRAYRMFIYMFTVLSVLGMGILYPVNYFWGAQDSKEDHTVFDSPLAYVSDLSSGGYAGAHAVMAYAFAIVLFFYIDRFALHTVTMRWHYLLLTRRAGTSRTLMVTRLPRELRAAPALAAFVEGMRMGQVEAVHVAPGSDALDRALADRARALNKLETAYAQVLGNPCRARSYDPVLLRRVALTDTLHARDVEKRLLRRWARKSAKGVEQRPTQLMLGKWWVTRVDAIDYWRGKLADADLALGRARNEVLNDSSAAFVTMRRPVDAYVISQLNVYARPNTCKIRMAPEARSLVWRNVGKPYSKKMLRHVGGLLLTIALLLLWCVPVVLISTLISLRFLVTRAPGLASVVQNNKFVRSLLSYTLPSLILTIFLTILPRLLWSFVLVGGDRAYSTADKNMWIRHLYFLIIYVVVILGMSGSVWTAVYDMFTDFGGFWDQIVAVLPQMATWYCVYVMLYGAGYQVMKLLHLKSVCRFLFHQARARTPRDFMKAISPVFIDWGTMQPHTVLFFFIGILYAHLQPLLLPMCTLYFAVGLFVMKYMTVYAWHFRQQNAGALWPVIIRRMVFCILLYQALTVAIFTSNSNHWFVAPMLVLMLFTWYYFWVRCRYLRQLSETLPLQLMREAERRRALASVPCTADRPCGLEDEPLGTRRDHVPRTRSWVAQLMLNGIVHPVQALVRSASYSVTWLQGDPAAPLWAHMDDYAFPERVSPRTASPAGRTAGHPTRAKEQPGSLVEIVKSTVVKLPGGMRAMVREFFLDFGVPPAHLDSSVTGYPPVDEGPREKRNVPRVLPLEISAENDVDLSAFCLAPSTDPLASAGVRVHSAATVMPAHDPLTQRPTAMQYQQHSSELPSGTRTNRKYTDFAQPNQSYVKGILDSTQFAYSHPGLYGDLPSLWLPVAHLKRRAERKRSAKQKLGDAKRVLTGLLQDNIIGDKHRRRDSVEMSTPPLAIVAFAGEKEISPNGDNLDQDHVVRLVEDLHVAAECGRLGIDPMMIAQWDPNGLHRCLSTVATNNHVAASISSEEPTTSLEDTTEYEVLSDSESDNSDSETNSTHGMPPKYMIGYSPRIGHIGRPTKSTTYFFDGAASLTNMRMFDLQTPGAYVFMLNTEHQTLDLEQVAESEKAHEVCALLPQTLCRYFVVRRKEVRGLRHRYVVVVVAWLPQKAELKDRVLYKSHIKDLCVQLRKVDHKFEIYD
ncbi:hypothetical protein GGI20_002626 [Coemansia sp. BCRC 34301]|nr:hypothetical protein GGI20_002626 [Coemansia sp. BCRC 34301]